jgi:hypothetical protein
MRQWGICSGGVAISLRGKDSMVPGAIAPHLFDFSEGYAEGETTHPLRAAAKNI